MTLAQKISIACLAFSDENGLLLLTSIGALKRLLMAQYQTEEPYHSSSNGEQVLVADELTKYASSMLLDPEYEVFLLQKLL